MAHPQTDIEKSNQVNDDSQKNITLNIREEVLSREFMKLSIKSLLKNNPHYKKEMVYSNPLDHMMVMSISVENKEITVSGKGRGNLTLDITGDSELVEEFVKTLTAEALTIVASEFSMCLKKTLPWISQDALQSKFRLHFKQAIVGSINECKIDK